MAELGLLPMMDQCVYQVLSKYDEKLGEITKIKEAAMEKELFGVAQEGTLVSRLSMLESEIVDFSRITRLEEELDISSGSSATPMARIGALEVALFGELQNGTIASRLTLLEKQLVG